MLTQEEIKKIMIPLLKERGQLYAKFLPIIARKAGGGEKIETVTGDGLETVNKAEEGEYIVQNQTKAGEQYVVGAKKFESRYQFLESLEGGWSRYQSTGKVWGIELTAALAQELNFKFPFYFIASWDSKMVVKEADFLVCPLDFGSVYRIARHEFFETYRLDS